jgi:type IV pilus assembly protein PilQ
MIRKLSFALFLLLALGAGAASAQNQLQSVDVQTLSGQQLQVRLQLSGPATEPASFTIDQPARIALDLADTKLALQSRRIDVKSGGLGYITAAEASGKVRLVLNLDAPMSYTTWPGRISNRS